ncbi:MAG: hypothetical protein IKE66_08850 [Hyphomicrobium sp.]|nr:hypothetical protein [Hyphomicrobium sp.]
MSSAKSAGTADEGDNFFARRSPSTSSTVNVAVAPNAVIAAKAGIHPSWTIAINRRLGWMAASAAMTNLGGLIA